MRTHCKCSLAVIGMYAIAIIVDATHVAAFPDSHSGDVRHADNSEASSRTQRKPVELIPMNDQLDWEVDNLGRVHVLVPAFTIQEDVTEENRNTLFKALDDPRQYAAAHVILSKLYSGNLGACATAVRDGFDIWYYGLKVQVRYTFNGMADEKTVRYPIEHRVYGSQQAAIAVRWKQTIELYQKHGIPPEMRDRTKGSEPYATWCDNRSYDLKGLTNQRVSWRTHGFGSVRPILSKVHRDEITRGNNEHVSHLLSLLKDESRFAAAHIALSCIFGVESFCVDRISGGLDVHLNGLHIVLQSDENGTLQATYPDSGRQQAWLQYRWMSVIAFEQSGNDEKLDK